MRPLLNRIGRVIPPTLNDADSQVSEINREWHQGYYHTLYSYMTMIQYMHISPIRICNRTHKHKNSHHVHYILIII